MAKYAKPSIKKGKWLKAKAVKFNKNGSISIKTLGTATLGDMSDAIAYKKAHPRAKKYRY
jgi:hypothetical protein